MASIQELPGGRKKIRFYDHQGERRAIHVGKIPKRLAESHADHIEALVNAKKGKFEADANHFVWVGEQNEKIRQALAKIGLIPPLKPDSPPVEPDPAPTLEAWFSQFIENRSGSVGTKKVWNRSKQQAVKFFGKTRLIDSIETGDAITWFERMLNGDSKGKGKLAEATARKMVGVARQVFKRALKFKHISENPFADEDLKTTIGHREKEYIEIQTIQQVLEILPSAEWRAVIVFARFAGMRVQSELPLLKWTDVQWDTNRFVVRSPKTSNIRRVPIFPEIKQALEDLLPITGDSEFVLSTLREKSNNWRTPLEKMMERAGIKPWDALYNSLRSSGEIDITRTYGLQCATEWVGNSVQIALKHYVRATNSDFARAANQESNFGPKSGPIVAQTDTQSPQITPEPVSAESSPSPVKQRKPTKTGLQVKNPEARSVDDIGLEPNGGTAVLQTTCDESPFSEKGFGPKSGPIVADSDLQTVIDAWPVLDDRTRVKILRDVQRALK